MSDNVRMSPASSPLKRPRLTSPVKVASPTKVSGMEHSPHKSGHSAREILSGALNEALKSRDVRVGSDLSEQGNTETVAAAAGAPASPVKTKGIRRKRRKGDATNSDYHHTFVMKLFDKSVDLAQFSPSTSLYPVCRAWMRNEPSNTNQAPRDRTPTPPPTGSPAADEDEDNEGKQIYSLPAPLPQEEDSEPRCPRIPEAAPVKLEGVNLETQSSVNTTSPAILLSNHMVRWWEVRKSWKQAAAKNELRYKKSLDILQNMFDDS